VCARSGKERRCGRADYDTSLYQPGGRGVALILRVAQSQGLQTASSVTNTTKIDGVVGRLRIMTCVECQYHGRCTIQSHGASFLR
jgi:hypothetical protein